jgi:hypothetical protein
MITLFNYLENLWWILLIVGVSVGGSLTIMFVFLDKKLNKKNKPDEVNEIDKKKYEEFTKTEVFQKMNNLFIQFFTSLNFNIPYQEICDREFWDSLVEGYDTIENIDDYFIFSDKLKADSIVVFEEVQKLVYDNEKYDCLKVRKYIDETFDIIDGFTKEPDDDIDLIDNHKKQKKHKKTRIRSSFFNVSLVRNF